MILGKDKERRQDVRRKAAAVISKVESYSQIPPPSQFNMRMEIPGHQNIPNMQGYQGN
jgi:hypothetical protein